MAKKTIWRPVTPFLCLPKQAIMSCITITYANILTQVKRFSAFEGREAADASGQSQFQKVLITEQDEDLINDYMKQGIGLVLGSVSEMIAGIVYNGDTSEVWTLKDSGYNHAVLGGALEQHVREAISAYIMSQWISNKIPEREPFYTRLFGSMLDMAKKNIFSRSGDSLNCTFRL